MGKRLAVDADAASSSKLAALVEAAQPTQQAQPFFPTYGTRLTFEAFIEALDPTDPDTIRAFYGLLRVVRSQHEQARRRAMREAMAAEAMAAEASAAPSSRSLWGGPTENPFGQPPPRPGLERSPYLENLATAPTAGDGPNVYERRRPVRRSAGMGWRGRDPAPGETLAADAALVWADVPSPPLFPMSPTYTPATPDYLAMTANDWVPRRHDAATETDGPPPEDAGNEAPVRASVNLLDAGNEAPVRASVNLLDVLFLGMLHARNAADADADPPSAAAAAAAEPPLPTAGAASRRRLSRFSGSGV